MGHGWIDPAVEADKRHRMADLQQTVNGLKREHDDVMMALAAANAEEDYAAVSATGKAVGALARERNEWKDWVSKARERVELLTTERDGALQLVEVVRAERDQVRAEARHLRSMLDGEPARMPALVVIAAGLFGLMPWMVGCVVLGYAGGVWMGIW